ncbi:cytochrome b-c1 complex subunit 7 [Armadillidium vulgare]|nr:cytochrome b-c1 complex subunit 7 [Armadillidium vulgare]
MAKNIRGTLIGSLGLRKWAHKASGYCKYGLYRDDCLHEYPHVEEAIKRLPPNLTHERNWRILRAFDHSTRKVYLPKEEWVSYEEDHEKGRYLQPYIQEVLAELEEKKRWAQ